MRNAAWDASATLAFPYSPDTPVTTPTTLRRAVESWRDLAPASRDDALLFVTEAANAERRVLGASEIALLAAQLSD